MKKENETPESQATLIQFFATWCHPCKILFPIVDAVGKKMKDRIHVNRVDIDSNPAMTDNFQVQAVPTLVLMKDGQEVWRHTGVLPESTLQHTLEAIITEK